MAPTTAFAVSAMTGMFKGSVFSFAIPQKIINASPLGDFQEQYDKSVRNSISYREKFIEEIADNLPQMHFIPRQLIWNIRRNVKRQAQLLCEGRFSCEYVS